MARQQNPEGSWYGRLKRLWVVLGAIVVGVIILAAFMSRRRELPVRAAKADRETITATIQTNGKIEPLNSFEAHSPAATAVQTSAGARRRARQSRTVAGRTGRCRYSVAGGAGPDANPRSRGGPERGAQRRHARRGADQPVAIGDRADRAGCGAAEPAGAAGTAEARSSVGGRSEGCGKPPEERAEHRIRCWSRS